MALPSELTLQQRLGCAVGLYVLQCEELEQLLKGLTPFMDSSDASVAGILARSAALKKKTLGIVARQFLNGVSGDAGDFKRYLAKIIEERNEVVHHFSERFGPLLAAGRQEEIFSDLKRRHREAAALSQALREMASQLGELLQT
jgi:hypothetical protein